MSEPEAIKSPKKVYISFFLLIFTAVLVVVFSRQAPKPVVQNAPKVSNFEQCAKLGYPIMESYPRQCASPDGKVFIETVTTKECLYNQQCPKNQACLDGQCKFIINH